MTESYFEQERQELRQMFGPSSSPISPGPDESFRTAVGAHQVPERFRRGGRPRYDKSFIYILLLILVFCIDLE